jgi:hypothetical protein
MMMSEEKVRDIGNLKIAQVFFRALNFCNQDIRLPSEIQTVCLSLIKDRFKEIKRIKSQK